MIYCDAAKSLGCTGVLTLQTLTDGKSSALRITVPLGTPITQACQAVPLHSLGGKKVIVTQAVEHAARLALAIGVPDPRDSAC